MPVGRLTLVALIFVLCAGALAWWWSASRPPVDVPPIAAPGDPASPAPAPPPAGVPAPSAPDQNDSATNGGDAEPPPAHPPSRIRVRCTPPRAPVTLPSSVVEAVESILALPEPRDLDEGAAQMTQCLELRDDIQRYDLPLYSRDHAAAVERVRQAVASCWQRWYAQPRSADDPTRVARAQVMEEVLDRAYPLVQSQDWEGLRAMADELAAMDAPMNPWDDWDPAVDLPHILGLRAEAPPEYFVDLLQAGHTPSPRALSRMATHERVDALTMLAEAGADLGATDISGNDVVHGAILSRDPAIVRAVAELGVDFNRRTVHPQVQHWPVAGDTEIGDGMAELLREDPSLAEAAVRSGYAVAPEHLQDILLHLPRDVGDEVYAALRADGC